MEILAPAGNALNFYTALDAGADAVYLGAPGINARNLSRDLKLEEIAAMISLAHEKGKKVYLAANSLILEKELPYLLESLAVFEKIQPDALIVQDMAVIELVLSYFPDLPLHASTLMGASHSGTVDLFGKMGCKRVVLARELTIKEIAELQKRASVELEVFVHGAMCYSFSGLCLFSSYLGGKSGMRGRCVQPCRRAYSWENKGKNRSGEERREKGGGSYLFSMNDLSSLGIVRELRDIGVASLKIEGRMRSANYVRKIVEAYRLVLDNDGDEALHEAETLVLEAMGRKTSPGYFLSPVPQDAIVPYHSGNMGLYLGSFTSIGEKAGLLVGKIRLKQAVQVGDRLRLHSDRSGERKAFTLTSMRFEGNEASEAHGEQVVQIPLPLDMAADLQGGGKVDLYKVDGIEEKLPADHGKRCAHERERVQQFSQQVRGPVKEMVHQLWEPDEDPLLEEAGKGRKQRNERIELWLKVDTDAALFQELPFKPDMFVLQMGKSLVSQAGRIKSYFGRNIRNVIWALPPIQFERDFWRLEKQVDILMRTGFKNFQLSHIGQRGIFGNERVNLFGGYTLNIANSLSLGILQQETFKGVQASIELDRAAYEELARGFKVACRRENRGEGMKLGLTVYGSPPLFSSRLDASFFNYTKSFVSPKNEAFYLAKEEGVVYTLPERPFSLLPYLSELQEMGYDYAVIDLSHMRFGEREKKELADRLRMVGKFKKLPTFNYLGNLE